MKKIEKKFGEGEKRSPGSNPILDVVKVLLYDIIYNRSLEV